jgi:RNA polymerase sigma-70 factor (ECF subfamily)
MKHIDGFEIEEIAGITGCRPEAVRVNLSRARKKVKEIFLKTQA